MTTSTPTVSIRQFFNGKTVLLTGGSGFVGKVMLWTLLNHVECARIYLIMRAKMCSKTGALKATPQQRLDTEIFGSPIFVGLPPADRARVQAVEGDLEVDEPLLNIAAADYRLVTDNVQIIIHGAASVRFQATLRENMNANTLGSLRVLQLAHSCRSLEVMVHISTAYVNSDLGTGVTVDEKLYPPLSDPEELLDLLMKATDPTVEMSAQTKKAVRRAQGSHFNTYTFTKQLAEHLILRRRKHLPLAICRPTIIGGSWRYPKPGWVDAALGAGALFAAGASGLIARVPGRPSVIGDQIPVDLVCHSVLAAAATVAARATHLVCLEPLDPINPDNLMVVHCSSSTSNPISWERTIEVVQAYFQTYPLSTDKRSVPKFDFLESTLVFSVLHYLLMIYPALILAVFWRIAAKLHISFEARKKKAEFLLKMARLGHNMAYAFAPFTCMEWFFSADNVQRMTNLIAADERDLFLMDARCIRWEEWLVNYAIGLRTNVLKDPASHEALESGTRNTLLQVTSRRAAELVSQSLLDLNRTQRLVTTACKEEVTDTSEALLEWTSAQLNPMVVIPIAMTVHRTLRSLFSSILIDSASLDYLRRLHSSLPPPPAIDALPTKNGRCMHPVLLLPTHKSYFDFVILSYACLAFDLRLPLVAADQVFASLPILSSLLRATGTFFLRRGGSSAELNNILRIYFTKSLMYHCWVQFFIEGSRSRTGFLLRPKLGLLRHALRLVETGEIESLRILPIGINYGELMESQSLSDELAGERKVGESLGRIFRGAVSVMNERFWDGGHQDKFAQARISIKAGPPITFRKSACDSTQAGWMITHALQDLRQLTLKELLAWSMLTIDKSYTTEMISVQVLELMEYVRLIVPGEDRARVFGIQMNRLKDQIEQMLLHQAPFRETFDHAKVCAEWRIKSHLTTSERNRRLNRVQFYRASALDLAAVDAFLAYTMERLHPTTEEEILTRSEELAKLFEDSAVGKRVCSTSNDVRVEALRRLQRSSSLIRCCLAGLLDPLMSGLRFFVDVNHRRAASEGDAGTISSVSTVDSERLMSDAGAHPISITECRRMAADREWSVGGFPLIDREVLRVMYKTSDLSALDDERMAQTSASLTMMGIGS